MNEKQIVISVRVKDLDRLEVFRRVKDPIPRKNNPGRGRGPSPIETWADLFERAVSALERRGDG